MKKQILLLLVMIIISSVVYAQWEEIFLYAGLHEFSSSSELDEVNPFEGVGKYNASNLFDHDSSTAWVEGKDDGGIGEYLYFETGKTIQKNIYIVNGYQKTENLYYLNNRVKTAKISLYIAFHLPGDITEIGSIYKCKMYGNDYIINLTDAIGTQVFKLPFVAEDFLKFKENTETLFYKEFKDEIDERKEVFVDFDGDCYSGIIMKFEIIDIYKGTKWNDTCISDIWLSDN